MVSGDITVGNMASPGYSPGCYVNGMNGIDLGDNVYIGPGTKIISANHDLSDHSRHVVSPRIRIGSNVWLGANVIVLPGVSIGDNTVVGAGSIVTKSLPSNVIAVGNPAKVIQCKDTEQ
jgi:acetyltransferase-like isoleucine patch superfamily enzyme